jgi:hypothetical protein
MEVMEVITGHILELKLVQVAVVLHLIIQVTMVKIILKQQHQDQQLLIKGLAVVVAMLTLVHILKAVAEVVQVVLVVLQMRVMEGLEELQI